MMFCSNSYQKKKKHRKSFAESCCVLLYFFTSSVCKVCVTDFMEFWENEQRFYLNFTK